jgi:hypothetical protein
VRHTVACPMRAKGIEGVVHLKPQRTSFSDNAAPASRRPDPPMRQGRHTERLLKAGIEPMVGGVGARADNALAKTINGPYKTGVNHCRGP